MTVWDRIMLAVQDSIVAHFVIVFVAVLVALAACVGFVLLVHWLGQTSPWLAIGACGVVLAAFVAGAIVSTR